MKYFKKKKLQKNKKKKKKIEAQRGKCPYMRGASQALDFITLSAAHVYHVGGGGEGGVNRKPAS